MYNKYYHLSREQLIDVFEDIQKWYQSDETLKDAIQNSINNNKIYTETDYPAIEKTHSEDIIISVNKYRTFETAQHYKRKFPELKIAALNFASATNVGGGVTKGSKAQEESLCRCSSLYPVLNTDVNHKSFYEYHRNRHDSRYTDRCIYSPDVVIIKSDEDIPTRLPSDKWTKVDILTCAAPNLRPIPNNFMNPGKDKAVSVSDEELFKIHVNRGKHILTIAAHHKADILILGAFGAGAFMNNPYIVAKAYREILPQFNGYFQEIVFAIYCSPNQSKDNLITFQKVFNKGK